MARELSLTKPIQRMIDRNRNKGKETTSNDKVNQVASSIENEFDDSTDLYGLGIQLIYDEFEDVIGVQGDTLNLQIFKDDEGNIDHIEEKYPNTDFPDMVRTNLDYLDNGNLDFVYTEVVRIDESDEYIEPQDSGDVVDDSIFIEKEADSNLNDDYLNYYK
jgi:hypothetical protein